MATWNVIAYTDIRPDRFDAEYFSKSYRDNVATLKMTGDVVSFDKLFHSICRGGQPDYNSKGTIPVLRSVNVGYMSFNTTRQEYVTKTFYAKMQKGQVYKDDVLVTSTGVGTLGRTSIWYSNKNAFCDGHISILRGHIVNPYFVTVFLNSKYGILQFDQNFRGSSGQIEIYPYDLSRFLIPAFLFKYQYEIGDYLVKAFELQEQSQSLYHQAEELLNKELQLDKLQLSHKKCYTANFSEVVNDNRMNAEYFSPTVKYILQQSFFKDASTIGELFSVVRGYTPSTYQTKGIPVIKTKNVRTPDIDKKRIADYANSSFPLSLTKEGDLLLAAMGVGSLGRMSYITNSDDNYAVDGTIRILRKKESSPQNIEIPTMLFLSSTIGQQLIYRGIVGSTGIISLPDDYLIRIPIPTFNDELKKMITQLVLNSISAKKDSENLLAQAKQRVEELIEQEANKK